MTKATLPKQSVTIDTDDFTWFTCEHGTYRIVQTRFGLYKSINQAGGDLLTALTEKGIHDCTPLHLLAQQPDYDGRYDHIMGKSTKHIDL